jgi:hypothetical protein
MAGMMDRFSTLKALERLVFRLGVSKTIAKTTGQHITSSAASLRMFDDKG